MYRYNPFFIILSIAASFRLFLFHPLHQHVEARLEHQDANIFIYNAHDEPVAIHCSEKRTETSPTRMVPFINDVLLPGTQMQVHYGKSLFEEILFCVFTTNRRTWNCGEDLIVEQCVWENPQSVMMRGSLPTDDDCPPCDQRNRQGEISCQWAVHNDGLYLNQYSLPQQDSYYFRKASWVDNDPEWVNLAATENLYQFSIRNDMENDVEIKCSNTMNAPVILRGRAHGDRVVVWHKQLDTFVDGNLVRTWVCDFLVEATGMHCNGVRIWTPPGVVHPVVQDPPCIDCAWKLTDSNIFLDRRDCSIDSPVWEPMHDWVQEDGS